MWKNKINSLDEVEAGDAVAAWRGGYFHMAIVVEVGHNDQTTKVVHVASTGTGKAGKKLCSIKEDSYATFKKNSEVYLVSFSDSWPHVMGFKKWGLSHLRDSYAPKTVVARARAAIGQDYPYHFLKKNCEVFTTWAKNECGWCAQSLSMHKDPLFPGLEAHLPCPLPYFRLDIADGTKVMLYLLDDSGHRQPCRVMKRKLVVVPTEQADVFIVHKKNSNDKTFGLKHVATQEFLFSPPPGQGFWHGPYGGSNVYCRYGSLKAGEELTIDWKGRPMFKQSARYWTTNAEGFVKCTESRREAQCFELAVQTR